jgi:hypothetical protein
MGFEGKYRICSTKVGVTVTSVLDRPNSRPRPESVSGLCALVITNTNASLKCSSSCCFAQNGAPSSRLADYIRIWLSRSLPDMNQFSFWARNNSVSTATDVWRTVSLSGAFRSTYGTWPTSRPRQRRSLPASQLRLLWAGQGGGRPCWPHSCDTFQFFLPRLAQVASYWGWCSL